MEVVTMLSFDLRDLDESFEMSLYITPNYKHKSLQRISINRADKDKPRMVPFTVAKKANAFRDRRRADRESACQPSTSNAATAAASLMELHIDDAGKPVGSVTSNSEHRRYGSRRVNYGNRNLPLVTHTWSVCF
jgi:hypothetical protein